MTRGGSETMLVDILNEQARRGHEVELLIVNDEEDTEITGGIVPQVHITRFRRRQGSKPLLLMARLNAFLLHRMPDVVHTHNYKLPGLIRLLRSRLLLTVHDINTPMTYTAGCRMVAISDAVREYILACRQDARVEVVLNGIVVENIALRSASKADDCFHFVQCGRLVCEKKGQDLNVAALAKIISRGYNADITFIGDGPDMEKLMQQAQELGVANYVHFRGALTRREVYAALSDFDAMSHPSRFEGFGLVVAEGMAAGLPLIVTEHDGPWEVAGRGRYCRSIPKGDVEALAAAMQWTMGNYAEAATLAQEARQYVQAHYSVARMVDDYLAYYQDLH